MPWQPCIAENSALARSAMDIAEAIRRRLIEGGSAPRLGLLDGQIGDLIFLFYFSAVVQDKHTYDVAFERLEEAIDSFSKQPGSLSFASGLAGVGWALEHLSEYGFVKSAEDAIVEDLDSILSEWMSRELADGRYDFLHGALGAGLFLLQRLRQHASGNRPHLKNLIDGLAQTAVWENKGISKWRDTFTKGDREAYNLGLAHGIPSIISFLSVLKQSGFNDPRVDPLLNGAVGYILSQRLSSASYFSWFPHIVVKNVQPLNSRLAWCYGDLGIGLSLMKAAHATRSQDLRDYSIDVLRSCACRREQQESMVQDVSICHGSLGIAHCFARAFNETREPNFQNAASYWTQDAILRANQERDLGGLTSARERGDGVPQFGILEGLGGIGLAILSLISGTEPSWDRCLLLS